MLSLRTIILSLCDYTLKVKNLAGKCPRCGGNFKRKLKDLVERLEKRVKENSIENINLNKREDLQLPPISNLGAPPKFSRYKNKIQTQAILTVYVPKSLKYHLF